MLAQKLHRKTEVVQTNGADIIEGRAIIVFNKLAKKPQTNLLQ
jgi:hypothetical protein